MQSEANPLRLINLFRHSSIPVGVTLNVSSISIGRKMQLPTLDGILAYAGLIYVYKLNRDPNRHGVPIPLTPIQVAHKFMFATTYPFLQADDGKIYAYCRGKYFRADIDSGKIYVDESDELDLNRISQPVLWTSRVYDNIAEYDYKHTVKIAGKAYTVQGKRGPFQNRMIYYINISASLFYIAYGHPTYIRKYLDRPLAIGYNYTNQLISAELYEHNISIRNIFTAERINGDGYVLLRPIPLKEFRRNEIIKAEYKAVRTQPPYYFDKGKTLCIGEGSIVRRKPRIHFLGR